MTTLERLRLATALGHHVPGTQLRLRTDRNEEIIVGHHHGADIDPCKMRSVVVASCCPHQPDLSRRITDVTVGGTLVSVGGGVYATRIDGREQRWITSLLGPECIAALLEDVVLDSLPDEVMHTRATPDSGLGVTVIVLTSTSRQFDHMLDDIAARTAAKCFVEELCRSITEVERGTS